MNPTLKPFAEFTAQWEGWSEVAYPDSKGIQTIGYGFNLERKDSRGRLSRVGLNLDWLLSGRQTCSREQGLLLMEADLSAAFSEATLQVPGLLNLPVPAGLIVVDLIYNLGAGGFREFPGFIAALRGHDWATAAAELMFRRVGEPALTGYFTDVKTRAHHHISALLKLHKDRAA